jgi:hypothetical protein
MRRLLKEELGQSSLVLLASMSIAISLSGAAIETAHVYYAYCLLQSSTNAAVLAAATEMPNIGVSSSPPAGTAYYNLYQYSAQTGELNATSLLQSVSISANFFCATTVSNSLNVGCQAPTTGEGSCSGNAASCNAVTATQTANVPLWFGGLLGFKILSVSAQATAAMRGGANTPWNIAIIMDTTASMNDNDSGAQCTGTQITCALEGLQILLGDLYPCAQGQTCTNPGVVPVDSVSLFVFPAVVNTTANVEKDYVCQTSDPTTVAYTIPNTSPAYPAFTGTPGPMPGSNLMPPSGDTYQILGFQNNYMTSDAAVSLNQAAPLVIAAGDSGVTGCSGLQAPGGEHTYYAQVIYAAQQALTAQQGLYPGSKNAIILLTDGNATACAGNANTSAGACSSSNQIVATEGTLNGTSSNTTVTYPSPLGECGQAVLAAQTAASQGTVFYTIGYGALNGGGNSSGGGCVSDKTYSTSVTTNGGKWQAGDSPCQALAAMASATTNFYSDDGDVCQATAPSNQNLKKLTQIFAAITNNLTVPRLIPNGTT